MEVEGASNEGSEGATCRSEGSEGTTCGVKVVKGTTWRSEGSERDYLKEWREWKGLPVGVKGVETTCRSEGSERDCLWEFGDWRTIYWKYNFSINPCVRVSLLVGLLWFLKRAGSHSSMLLCKHLFSTCLIKGSSTARPRWREPGIDMRRLCKENLWF